MENKDNKEFTAVELDDDMLDNSSGGAIADTCSCPHCKKDIPSASQICPYCNATLIIVQPWFR